MGPSAGDVSQDCRRLAEQSAPSVAAKSIVLVVDNTASNAGGDLPPAIVAKLREAQANHEQLTIIAVNGTGAVPAMVRTIGLDPDPGNEAQVAKNARSIVIGCVSEWGRGKEAAPTAAGSDILGALNAASRQPAEQVLVVSDGLTNAAPFDLNAVGFDADPTVLAASLHAAGAVAPTLSDRHILWTDLAESATQVPQSARTALQALWTAVLQAAGAIVTFDPTPGKPAGAANGLPPDETRLPSVATSQTGCHTQITVPAALLFGANSAQLQPGAMDVVNAAAARLKANPDWVATISGHTANYGTATSQQQLSVERAKTVLEALVSLGVARDRLSADGYGSTRPAAPEIVNGTHDATAATKNRRVVIEMGPRGCAS